MYRVVDIFFSLQGEGFWTGTPMVFLRLGGCNLKCPFCDTDHSHYLEMSVDEILMGLHFTGGTCRRVCVTGGEPALQLDRELVDALHAAGYRIHVETNGTRALPEGVDWVTLSPKADVPGLQGDGTVVLEKADEVKVVFQGQDVERWSGFPAGAHFLQPCDTGDPARNAEILRKTLDYILEHPRWRMSLQTHKILKIK